MKKNQPHSKALCAKWETHAHTNLVSPCSYVAPKQLVELYLGAKYQGIIVTDHYCAHSLSPVRGRPWRTQADFLLSGYRAVAEYGAARGLRVALGFEVTLEDEPHDFLVFGMTEKELAKYPMLCKLSLARFRSVADECGWLVYQAHPYRYGLSPVDAKWLDGVEARNAHPTHQSHNHRARAFAQKHGLWMSCGSDTHSASYTPCGGMMFESHVHDARSVAECIRKYQGKVLLLEDDTHEYMIGG